MKNGEESNGRKVLGKAEHLPPLLLAKSKVEIVALIVVIGFTISVIYHYVNAMYGGLHYPYNTFLFEPGNHFNDFSLLLKAVAGLNPYSNGRGLYFPFIYVALYPFTLLPAKLAFFLFAGSFIIFFGYFNYRNLFMYEGTSKATYWFILSFMSYPFLYVLDLGNLEVWVFICIVMFFYLYKTGKENLSLIFLAIAISFKLFPAELLLFLFVERRYKAIAITLVTCAVLTIGGAALLKGGAIHSFNSEMACLPFGQKFIESSNPLEHSSSLYTPLKLCYYNVITHINPVPEFYEAMFTKYYSLFSALFLLMVAAVVVRFKMPIWQLVALLVSTFILITPMSFDYKLIHLFVPLAFFIRSPTPSKHDKLFSIIFGLLLIPKDYAFIAMSISISSILNPLLILALMCLIISDLVKERRIRRLLGND